MLHHCPLHPPSSALLSTPPCLPALPQTPRVDVAALADELQSIGDMLQQDVSVAEHYVLFADCDHCVTAFSG